MISRLLCAFYSTQKNSTPPGPKAPDGYKLAFKLKPISASNNIKIIIAIAVASFIIGKGVSNYLMRQAKETKQQGERQLPKIGNKREV
jgi:hypothetical protein